MDNLATLVKLILLKKHNLHKYKKIVGHVVIQVKNMIYLSTTRHKIILTVKEQNNILQMQNINKKNSEITNLLVIMQYYYK